MRCNIAGEPREHLHELKEQFKQVQELKEIFFHDRRLFAPFARIDETICKNVHEHLSLLEQCLERISTLTLRSTLPEDAGDVYGMDWRTRHVARVLTKLLVEVETLGLSEQITEIVIKKREIIKLFPQLDAVINRLLEVIFSLDLLVWYEQRIVLELSSKQKA